MKTGRDGVTDHLYFVTNSLKGKGTGADSIGHGVHVPPLLQMADTGAP